MINITKIDWSVCMFIKNIIKNSYSYGFQLLSSFYYPKYNIIYANMYCDNDNKPYVNQYNWIKAYFLECVQNVRKI